MYRKTKLFVVHLSDFKCILLTTTQEKIDSSIRTTLYYMHAQYLANIIVINVGRRKTCYGLVTAVVCRMRTGKERPLSALKPHWLQRYARVVESVPIFYNIIHTTRCGVVFRVFFNQLNSYAEDVCTVLRARACFNYITRY